MADVVETASYIAFQHPARMSCEGLEAAFDRIRAGTPLAKPIGVFIRLRLCHGIESKQVKCLHGSVLHGGDAERT